MIFIMMLIRWTLPRFRYDQAMRLGAGWALSALDPEHRADRGRAARVGWAPVRVGQRFYLREVLSGLVLTGHHFFANMGSTSRTRSAAPTRAAPSPSSTGGAAADVAAAASLQPARAPRRTARRAAWPA